MAEITTPAIVTTPSESGTASPPDRGATLRTLHTHREVKLYPLLETEIENLANLSRDQRLWSSIGSFCAAFLAGCIWDAIVNTPGETPIPPRSWLTMIGLALGIGFSIFKAMQYGWRRRMALEALVPPSEPPLIDECIKTFKNKVRKWIRE